MPVAPPSLNPTPTTQAVSDNLRGVAWMLFSVLAASAMSVSVRWLADGLDSRMILMLRAGVSCMIVLPLLIVPLFWRQMRFSRPGQHIIRGLLIAFSTHLGFYTLAHVPLATATVLFFTAPIFAVIIAAVLLGEKVGPRRWSAVGAGFVGAAIILRPGFGTLDPAMLAALGSSVLFAAALSMSRGLAQADGPLSAFVSSVFVTALVTLPIAAPVWEMPASVGMWVAVAVLVTTGAMRNVGDIQAYRYADAALLAPITYLRIVVIGVAGYALFGEVIDGPTLAGTVLIVGSTLYIAHRARIRGASKR
ncbi:DMT family transporter [Roseobacter sp. HKCCA0434]|uniref:DMT family transporter n=1 Tax=Roseobacter sp. HKCCA0434 TaxID=3079297 RepID=UPI002905A448|nr:DMT family transporter [Roseobacter sp. HKCCA0434]